MATKRHSVIRLLSESESHDTAQDADGMGAETGNGNNNCNNEVLDENDEDNAPTTPGLGGPDTNADFWATVERVKGVAKALKFSL